MIFIDTNIYLEFYNSNRPEFKKLLSSLVELRNDILVTSQIVDEVNRNKLSVFSTSVGNTLNNVSFKSVVLPSHLDSIETTTIKAWNDERKTIELAAEKNIIKLKAIYTDLFNAISSSKDVISIELGKIFSTSQEYTDEALILARHRKELGNPPGKPKDNMGDQLSWEVLLENLHSESEVIIVTRDTDYYTTYNDQCFLNPQLLKELVSINPNLNIKCYNKLSDALRDYNNSIQIQSLPSKFELETISKQEPTSELKISSAGGLKLVPDVPDLCPQCNSKDTFKYPGFKKSVLNFPPTYHYTCLSCGFEFNTFE